MHVESVPVKETFQGKTVWEGVVEVFDLHGHPKDRGKALAGKRTLNRLELGKAREIDKYKKILMHEHQIDARMVRAFIDAHGSVPDEIVLDLDATDLI